MTCKVRTGISVSPCHCPRVVSERYVFRLSTFYVFHPEGQLPSLHTSFPVSETSVCADSHLGSRRGMLDSLVPGRLKSRMKTRTSYIQEVSCH